MNNSELRKYKKEIERKLPYPQRKRKKLLSELYAQIDDFIENAPLCSITDIHNHFGTPDVIVLSILSPEDTVTYSKKSMRTKIWIGLTILVTIALGFTIYCLYRINESGSNYHRFSSFESEPIYQDQGD